MSEQEVSADTAIGKFKVSGQNLNHLATVVTLIIVVLIGVLLYQHMTQATVKDTGLASALSDMVQAQREQNCLIAIPEATRESKAEFCKRVTR